ncbi:hypothetical protein DPMN_089309 [Dreissena polymorpha]|uniref:Uncharacterized protein n=1 Tax=Dreissena polymorpha TaxID=45954 RepID=A0A9D4KVQ0_DREPO|nr:hypothetical protein DPMN_089309 [Dreissena polymorpha]
MITPVNVKPTSQRPTKTTSKDQVGRQKVFDGTLATNCEKMGLNTSERPTAVR